MWKTGLPHRARFLGALVQFSNPHIACTALFSLLLVPEDNSVNHLIARQTYPLIRIPCLAMFSIPTISMRGKRPTTHGFLPSGRLFRNLQQINRHLNSKYDVKFTILINLFYEFLRIQTTWFCRATGAKTLTKNKHWWT